MTEFLAFRMRNMKPVVMAAVAACATVAWFWVSSLFAQDLLARYARERSVVVADRFGEIIAVKPNARGHYTRPISRLPPRFIKFLLKKEDRFFYYHPGINPISALRGAFRWAIRGDTGGASTITEQLVKVLLHHEEKRTVLNKTAEAVYALALEIHVGKQQILRMYADIVYFGALAQGLGEGSARYFGKAPDLLTDEEIFMLIAAMGNPAARKPETQANKERAKQLARMFGGVGVNDFSYQEGATMPRKTATAFEIESFAPLCARSCVLTVDARLTEKIREVLRRSLAEPPFASVKNGAVVVVKLPENELLALIGSPNPDSPLAGMQVNMAVLPRQIGSTVKPFIYLKAFEKGMRPYTLIDDREYRYLIGTGFPLYPKNYDETYRGIVTAHHALSNSLNVPAVKVLEYAGLPEFYEFLERDLGFKPVQPLENYELGIALGALEMDLLTLSTFFTIFPNQGELRPITLVRGDGSASPPLARIDGARRVAPLPMIQLVNKILSDRASGAEQFGIKSHLNLFQTNYALKTGTSREFRDSWIIGYTPDFLIGAWVGNANNDPMDRVSGSEGAGRIWSEVAGILLNLPYNKKTPFAFNKIAEYVESGAIEYGLMGDDYAALRDLFIASSSSRILSPHEGDEFLLTESVAIPLYAREDARWFANGREIGIGKRVAWRPERADRYTIVAFFREGAEERVTVQVAAE